MWLLGTDLACDLLTSTSFTQVRQLKWHRDNDVIGHTICLLTAFFLAFRYTLEGGRAPNDDLKTFVLFAICYIFQGLASYMVTK